MTRIVGPHGWICPDCHGHTGLDHSADCGYEERMAEEDARLDAEEFLGDWVRHLSPRMRPSQEITYVGDIRRYDRRLAEQDRERERSE